MKIYSVSDPAFKPYGKVLTGFDTAALIAAMKTVPMPESGTAYEPSIPALEESGIFDAMQNRAYGTTLHYAPCQTEKTGFRVAVVLPKGTNTEKPAFEPQSEEDTWMTARNKWLLAHPDSSEAKTGAHIGLTGKNIDITEN